MSGHSKWATIKHQKGVADARRGQLFTKLTREIIVAVKQSGGDAETNFRLRLAIQKAREANMPMDNIQRAIKRGSGETDGAALVEMVLEGYGPGGAAILVQALSDNRNRTVQEVRNLFTRSGGNMGESGCVAWLFEQKGLISIDAGAEDVNIEGTSIEIYTNTNDYMQVRESLTQAGLEIESSEVTMIPKTTIDLDEKQAHQNLKLLNKLEELDDVQTVSSNINFTEDILNSYEE